MNGTRGRKAVYGVPQEKSLILRVTPGTKLQFEERCKGQEKNPSEVLREFVAGYISGKSKEMNMQEV